MTPPQTPATAEGGWTAGACAAEIAKLDKQINANRREWRTLANLIGDYSCREAQVAWDKFPALAARDQQLFRQRGELQLARDTALATARNRAAAAAARRQLPKCRACNGTGIAA